MTLAEVELLGLTSVIADLHLDPFEAPRCSEFRAWMGGLQVSSLFILGDLFDAWVGPAHESAPGAVEVIAGLRDLGERGVSVHLLQGNRDFLLGASFERAAACRVHEEGFVGVFPAGERWLFLHGDELCTRDRAYQRLRRVTHSAVVQKWGPRVPLFISRRIAARLRRYSTKAVAGKPSEEKRIQESAARERAAGSECVVLVCGHVHEARDERLPEGPRWLILDAYGVGPRDVLGIDATGHASLHSSAELSASGDSVGGVSGGSAIQ